MTTPSYFAIDRVSVIDVGGADADTIVHNLTTNEIKSLPPGVGCETFVTDVRGKTLGHVFLYREDGFLRMIGACGQSEVIAQHVDRYTIREDATPLVRDDEFSAIVIPPDSRVFTDGAIRAEPAIATKSDNHVSKSTWRVGDAAINLYQTRWLGEQTLVLLVGTSQQNLLEDALSADSLIAGDEAAFHAARTLAGFPWHGIDLDDSNLPQEADRDPFAISFTKGCYLGQETVARLDAMGQVQKKLVRWSIDKGIPEVGAKLVVGDKTVGRLTSVTADGQGGAIAIGVARRSHFDAGSIATGLLEASGDEFTGTVI